MRNAPVMATTLVLAFGLSAATANACSIRLGWEDFAPFQLERDGTVTGLDVDLFLATADAAGCTVTPKELPWRRLLSDMEAGRIDAAMGASITPERETFARFSDAYRHDEIVLFVLTDKLGAVGPGGLEDLPGTGFRLGTVTDYAYGCLFDRLMGNTDFTAQVEPSRSTTLNVRKAKAGRLDGFIEDRFVGQAAVQSGSASGLMTIHPTPVTQEPVHFMFSRKSVPAGTVIALNAALATLKADGRYDSIVAQYLD